MESILALKGIKKAFAGTAALQGVDFDVRAGEVHALLGENGAGKSTLIKIIAGVHHPDEGTITLDGRSVTFAAPGDSTAAGVATVYQELLLFPELTVAENIFLGHAPRRPWGGLDWSAMRRRARQLLDEYGYRFELGKAALLRGGNDVLVISSGLMTMRALEVAAQLESDGVDVAALHVPTIKPLDEAAILAEGGKTGRLVVVAENHLIVGGLGEAAAGLLLRNGVTPAFRQIALPDAFLDAGALSTLHDRYDISTSAMRATIKGWL